MPWSALHYNLKFYTFTNYLEVTISWATPPQRKRQTFTHMQSQWKRGDWGSGILPKYLISSSDHWIAAHPPEPKLCHHVIQLISECYHCFVNALFSAYKLLIIKIFKKIKHNVASISISPPFFKCLQTGSQYQLVHQQSTNLVWAVIFMVMFTGLMRTGATLTFPCASLEGWHLWFLDKWLHNETYWMDLP